MNGRESSELDGGTCHSHWGSLDHHCVGSVKQVPKLPPKRPQPLPLLCGGKCGQYGVCGRLSAMPTSADSIPTCTSEQMIKETVCQIGAPPEEEKG